MKNQFNIQILEDGTISVDSGSFDPTVHKSADDFVKYLGELMGGQITVREKKSHAKTHIHVGKELHEHEDGHVH
jgi:hypothetical protein